MRDDPRCRRGRAGSRARPRAGLADRAGERGRRPSRRRRRSDRRRLRADDPGFFNYTDYEYSALRNFARRRVGRDSGEPEISGARRDPHRPRQSLRTVCALRAHSSVGRVVGSTFRSGAFRRRSVLYGRDTYGTANLLIGTPLAYQYLTSLRPDALPRVNDDLIRMRGRGWLSNFPVGNLAPDRGLPVINSVPVGHRACRCTA